MSLFFLFLTLCCVASVAHTYLLYPWWVMRKAANSGARPRVQTPPSGATRQPPKGEVEGAGNWPIVHVLMAVHNEEIVLEAKLASLAAQDYPGPLHFLIGSDNSSDRTNDILLAWAKKDERFRPTLFDERQGKPGIINQLAASSAVSGQRSGHDSNQRSEHSLNSPLANSAPLPLGEGLGIFLLTDASVLLRPNTITELIRPMLENERIGVVDATMIQTGGRAEGIGLAEEQYINREVHIKRAEGQLWGAMIGPFGGCWAMRAEAFRPVPDNFLVDDFFLCMAAYEQDWRGVSSPDAVVEEAVGQTMGDEFRRKVRISSGNWQNLVRFRKLWWPPTKSALAFAFFSHKVLRWWTPFFLLIGVLSWIGYVLSSGNHWAMIAFVFLTTIVGLSVILDLVLAPRGIHLAGLRSLRYFLAMNAALLVGFYRFLTGITSNVWQPSNRN